MFFQQSYSTITNKQLAKFSDALAKKRPKSLEINLWNSEVQQNFFDILLRGIAPTQIETLSISFMYSKKYVDGTFDMTAEDFSRFKAFENSPLKSLQLKFFEFDKDLELYADPARLNHLYEGMPIDIVKLKDSLPVRLLQNLKSLSLGIYGLQPSGLSALITQATALDSVSLAIYHDEADQKPKNDEFILVLNKIRTFDRISSLKLIIVADTDAASVRELGESLTHLSSNLRKLNFTLEKLGISRLSNVEFISNYISRLDNLISLSLLWQKYFGDNVPGSLDFQQEADGLATLLGCTLGTQLVMFEFALNSNFGISILQAGTFTALISSIGNLVIAEKINLNLVGGNFGSSELQALWVQLKLLNGGQLKELLIDIRQIEFGAFVFTTTDSLVGFQDTLELFSFKIVDPYYYSRDLDFPLI